MATIAIGSAVILISGAEVALIGTLLFFSLATAVAAHALFR